MTLKPKEIYIRTIRLKHDKLKQILAEAEAIMKRENWSFDQLTAEALLEYNVRHGAGNNSFQLDTFGVTWTRAQSVNKCGFAKCTEIAVGVGLYKPKNQTLGLCRGHFQAAKANPRLWMELKISEEKP